METSAGKGGNESLNFSMCCFEGTLAAASALAQLALKAALGIVGVKMRGPWNGRCQLTP